MATHYCESNRLPELEKGLLNLQNAKDVDDFLNDFCLKPKSEFILSKHLDQINTVFDASSVEEILSNLEKDNSEWAKQVIRVHIFIYISYYMNHIKKFYLILLYIHFHKYFSDSSNTMSNQCEDYFSKFKARRKYVIG